MDRRCIRNADISSLKTRFLSENLKNACVICEMLIANAEKAKNMKIIKYTRSGLFTGVTSAGIVLITPSVQ